MAKKFTNVVDRGRVVPHKYNFVDNKNGTTIITDIPNNINVQGTKLNKDLFNPMQEGLIFTVDTLHSNDNDVDVYELDLKGLKGTSETEGLKIFKGLAINIKINTESTSENIMIKLSGDNYRLLSENKENLQIGQLKTDKYYQIVFENNLFILTFGSVNDAKEENKGIAKIYSESESETDSDKVKAVVEAGNGEEREFLREDPGLGAVYGDSYWEKLIKVLDHTKILTVKGLVKILRKIIKPATDNQ